MAIVDWKEWCHGVDTVTLSGETAVIALPDGRSQKVRVKATEATFEFSSVVVSAGQVTSLEEAALRAWRRNRSTQMVGFGLDRNGRLMADAWVPLAGLTPEEFVATLRHVAEEADLFEYQLTGEDRG